MQLDYEQLLSGGMAVKISGISIESLAGFEQALKTLVADGVIKERDGSVERVTYHIETLQPRQHG